MTEARIIMMAPKWSIPVLLVVSLMVLMPGLGAQAELLNVNCGGSYYVPETECFVHLYSLKGAPEDGAQSSLTLDGERRSAGLKARVPDQPRPKRYSSMGRVFLSFYVGVPAWDDGEQGRIDVVVRVGDYQVFECDVTEPGWHPYLVDLRPWAGQEVALTFRSGVREGEPREAIIALPRLVACYGPRSSGEAGLRVRGEFPRGHGALAGLANVKNLYGGHNIHVDGTVMSNGPLLVQRLDFVEPSSVLLKSDVQEYTATLPKGLHWLAIQLPAEKEPCVEMGLVEGFVQGGPTDVIPNFMANDAKVLAKIQTKSLVLTAE